MTSLPRVRLAALALSALLMAVLAVAAGPAERADAWAWDPNVTLNGKIGCNYGAANTVEWGWIEGSNGERGWANLGAGGMTRSYYFDFHHVPMSTMTVTVKWGCRYIGEFRTSFGLNRPSTGKTATRNICHWSPCIL